MTLLMLNPVFRISFFLMPISLPGAFLIPLSLPGAFLIPLIIPSLFPIQEKALFCLLNMAARRFLLLSSVLSGTNLKTFPIY